LETLNAPTLETDQLPFPAGAAEAPKKTGFLAPLLMTFIRFPLLLVGFGATFAILNWLRHPTPFASALYLSNVYTTLLADIPCVLALVWLMRREGGRLRDLFGRGRNLALDLLLGVGLGIGLMIIFYAANLLAALIVYGPSYFQSSSSATPAIPVDPFHLPAVAYWWAALVLPFSAGLVEELTYRGYALPRLIAATRSRWLGVALMSLGFATQHIAYALGDPQAMAARFLGILFVAPVFALLYLWLKRLLPLIVAHMLLDYVGLGLISLYLALHL
jgi:membrane protease YdiL (CAAX protease family)